MSLFKRVGLGFATGGLSEVYRGLRRNFGGGGGGSIDPSIFRDSGAGNKFEADKVSSIYQAVLGRAPNQDEIEQFKTFVEKGDLGYQDIAEIIGGLPEAQQNLLQSQTTDLEGRLGASDDRILNRAMSSLESRYRQMGRSQTTGFDSSFARSAEDLAMSRQNALNNFYSSGLTGVRDAYANLGAGTRQRGYNLSDSRTDYNRGLNMAAMGQAYQSNRDQQSFQAQQKQALGQLLGTGLGLGVGGALGGKFGAYMGGQLGSSLGQTAGLLGQRRY